MSFSQKVTKEYYVPSSFKKELAELRTMIYQLLPDENRKLFDDGTPVPAALVDPIDGERKYYQISPTIKIPYITPEDDAYVVAVLYKSIHFLLQKLNEDATEKSLMDLGKQLFLKFDEIFTTRYPNCRFKKYAKADLTTKQEVKPACGKSSESALKLIKKFLEKAESQNTADEKDVFKDDIAIILISLPANEEINLEKLKEISDANDKKLILIKKDNHYHVYTPHVGLNGQEVEFIWRKGWVSNESNPFAELKFPNNGAPSFLISHLFTTDMISAIMSRIKVPKDFHRRKKNVLLLGIGNEQYYGIKKELTTGAIVGPQLNKLISRIQINLDWVAVQTIKGFFKSAAKVGDDIRKRLTKHASRKTILYSEDKESITRSIAAQKVQMTGYFEEHEEISSIAQFIFKELTKIEAQVALLGTLGASPVQAAQLEDLTLSPIQAPAPAPAPGPNLTSVSDPDLTLTPVNQEIASIGISEPAILTTDTKIEKLQHDVSGPKKIEDKTELQNETKFDAVIPIKEAHEADKTTEVKQTDDYSGALVVSVSIDAVSIIPHTAPAPPGIEVHEMQQVPSKRPQLGSRRAKHFTSSSQDDSIEIEQEKIDMLDELNKELGEELQSNHYTTAAIKLGLIKKYIDPLNRHIEFFKKSVGFAAGSSQVTLSINQKSFFEKLITIKYNLYSYFLIIDPDSSDLYTNIKQIFLKLNAMFERLMLRTSHATSASTRPTKRQRKKNGVNTKLSNPQTVRNKKKHDVFAHEKKETENLQRQEQQHQKQTMSTQTEAEKAEKEKAEKEKAEKEKAEKEKAEKEKAEKEEAEKEKAEEEKAEKEKVEKAKAEKEKSLKEQKFAKKIEKLNSNIKRYHVRFQKEMARFNRIFDNVPTIEVDRYICHGNSLDNKDNKAIATIEADLKAIDDLSLLDIDVQEIKKSREALILETNSQLDVDQTKLPIILETGYLPTIDDQKNTNFRFRLDRVKSRLMGAKEALAGNKPVLYNKKIKKINEIIHDTGIFSVCNRRRINNRGVSESVYQIAEKTKNTHPNSNENQYTSEQCESFFTIVATQLKGKETPGKWCSLFGSRTKKTAEVHKQILDLVPDKYKTSSRT